MGMTIVFIMAVRHDRKCKDNKQCSKCKKSAPAFRFTNINRQGVLVENLCEECSKARAAASNTIPSFDEFLDDNLKPR